MDTSWPGQGAGDFTARPVVGGHFALLGLLGAPANAPSARSMRGRS